jgi:hypothetical protein
VKTPECENGREDAKAEDGINCGESLSTDKIPNKDTTKVPEAANWEDAETIGDRLKPRDAAKPEELPKDDEIRTSDDAVNA